MGKGKRQRQRRERREQRESERVTEIDVDDYAQAHEAGMSYEEKADKGIIGVSERKASAPLYGGYRFEGDILVNGRGEPLGRWPWDFEPRWIREHRRRMDVMRLFHERVEPYWRPRMELL